MTWGFVIANTVIAHSGSSTNAILIVRDSWTILAFVYLILVGAFAELLIILWVVTVATIAILLNDFDLSRAQIMAYGLRDIFLIVLISRLLYGREAWTSGRRPADKFLIFCLAFASLEIAQLLFHFDIGIYKIFPMSEYYEEKGVTANLYGGLFEMNRVSVPLYSPNILGAMLILSAIYSPRSKKSIYSLVLASASLFTTTKNIFVAIFVRLLSFSKFALVIFCMLGLPLGFLFFSAVFSNATSAFVLYHSASILGHFHAFQQSADAGLFNIVPSLVGSKSTLAAAMSCCDIRGIESTLLARWVELGLWFTPVLLYLIYVASKIKDREKFSFFCLFLLLITLSSTNNHPIAYFPALIYLCSNERKMNYVKTPA